MGNCVGGFKSQAKRTSVCFRRKKKVTLCVLGIDGAGKTTITRALESGDLNDIFPTNGFSVSHFRCNRTDITMYDVGGGERIRAIWSNYYAEVFGIIYVIDGSNAQRLNETGDVLKEVIADKNLEQKPLLILLNKRDRPGVINEIELTDRLNLHQLARQHNATIRIEICTANRGTGKNMDPAIKDGIYWLLDNINYRYDELNKRVKDALKELKAKQDEDRLRRQQAVVEAAKKADQMDSNEEVAAKVDVPTKKTQTTDGNRPPSPVQKRANLPKIFVKFANNRVAPLSSRSLDIGSSFTSDQDASTSCPPRPSRLPPLNTSESSVPNNLQNAQALKDPFIFTKKPRSSPRSGSTQLTVPPIMPITKYRRHRTSST
ncbi:hypothetical protein AB6A40_001851 [Gnathostoma spinigerum]|uniref:ADP-ribosylation factor-like protein 13B n=1 Tax=Gnathostoma spinigerum TaxID=75299 RepID=A0ABD6EF40_9BILA